MIDVAQDRVWSAMPTPFLDDGALDEDSLDGLIEQHERLGVTGLFLAGTCGEGPFMPNSRRVALVAAVKRRAGERLHLSVQVSDTSASRVRDNIVAVQEAGADSVVIAPPWIVRFCSPGFVRRYFLEPLEAARVPVGLYVLPPAATGIELDPSLWTELAAHPKVRFVKDSSSSAERRDALIEVRKRRPELVLRTGDEFDVLATVGAGYDGAVLGTGILTGGMIGRAIDALAAGDRAAAEAWQQRSNEFLNDLFRLDRTGWLGGLKYALVRLGLFQSDFRHLDYPITDDDRRRIDEALERERALIRPGSAGEGVA